MPCLTEHPDHQEYQKRHDISVTTAVNTIPTVPAAAECPRGEPRGDNNTANSAANSAANSTVHHGPGPSSSYETNNDGTVPLSAPMSATSAMPVSAAGAAGAAGAVAPYGVMGIKPDLSKFSSVMGGGRRRCRDMVRFISLVYWLTATWYAIYLVEFNAELVC